MATRRKRLETARRAIESVARAMAGPRVHRPRKRPRCDGHFPYRFGRPGRGFDSTFASRVRRLRIQNPADPSIAFPLQGIGAARLAMGEPMWPSRFSRMPCDFARPRSRFNTTSPKAAIRWPAHSGRPTRSNASGQPREECTAGVRERNFPRQEHAVAEWLATHKVAQR